MNELRVLSLFSGAGGMDLGFEGGFQVLSRSVDPSLCLSWSKNGQARLVRTRFRTVFACDIMEQAKKAWCRHFHDYDPDIYHQESIVDLVKLHKEGKFQFPEADVVTGGFPCQDFSHSGKRKGFKSSKGHNGKKLVDVVGDATTENRGMLYMWMRAVVDIVKPKVFVAENVKGLTTLEDAKEIIEQDFRNIGGGYLVVPAQVLDASDYGVPQARERVLFIGFRRDALDADMVAGLEDGSVSPYPSKTHGDKLLPKISAVDAVKDLPEPRLSQDPTHRAVSGAKYMGKHCQGNNEISAVKPGPTIRSEHHGNIEYRRLSLANGGKLVDELSAGLPERRMSVRECARLQTFPDDYEFVFKDDNTKKKFSVSQSKGYVLVGNAIPPLLAYHVARRLECLWPALFKG